VDAREQLRRFLEQRRDAGVRELILDDLTVDEVMRLVGAMNTGGSDSPGPEPRPGRETPRVVPPGADAPERTPAAEPDPSAPTDWRSALRAAGAEPGGSRPEKPTAPPASQPEPPQTTSLDNVPSGIVVGAAGSELFGGPMSHLNTLDELAAAVASCTRCPLYRTATNPVPGEGNPQARLMCVGEAPGATEDATGRPFVGQAGQLLDRILSAINLSRNDVFICNVLKHRPPQNRNPLPDEVRACSPYLVRQIELIRPRVILALGTFAAQTLLNTKDSIGKLRGRVHRYHGVPLVVTYHPAALLLSPASNGPTWNDVQLAQRPLDRANGL